MSYELHQRFYDSCYLLSLFSAYGYLRSPTSDRALTTDEITHLLSQSTQDKNFYTHLQLYIQHRITPTPLQQLIQSYRTEYHKLPYSEKKKHLQTFEKLVRIVDQIFYPITLRNARKIYTLYQEYLTLPYSNIFANFPLLTYTQDTPCPVAHLVTPEIKIGDLIQHTQDIPDIKYTLYYMGLHIYHYEIHSWKP